MSERARPRTYGYLRDRAQRAYAFCDCAISAGCDTLTCLRMANFKGTVFESTRMFTEKEFGPGGAVFYLWKRLPYHHAIWHLCVLGGSACHWAAIFLHVVPAAS